MASDDHPSSWCHTSPLATPSRPFLPSSLRYLSKIFERDRKYSSFEICKPHVQGSSSSTRGVIHKELDFKYQISSSVSI